MDTVPASELNPCLSCGICCTHFRISFYHGEIDDMPAGYVPAEMVEQVTPFRACMKGTNQVNNRRCIALSGSLGVHTFCTIYEYRPSVCREFDVWDESGQPNPCCQELRLAYELPPLMPLSVAAEVVPVAVTELISDASLLIVQLPTDGMELS